MSSTGSNGIWAQGSLQLFSGPELLRLLADRALSGRLVLVSAAVPHRVVSVHLEEGAPVLAVGTGLPRSDSPEWDSFRARQLLLDALTWSHGKFRVEALDRVLPPGSPSQELGDVDDLISAAAERAASWPRLVRRLGIPWPEARISAESWSALPDDPLQQAVLQALDGPQRLVDLPFLCAADEHRLLAAVLDMVEEGLVSLGTVVETPASTDPDLEKLLPAISGILSPEDHEDCELKIAVLSWDSRTIFRAVEALVGRHAEPPPDVESQPRYQVLHETVPLAGHHRLEVLGFRADAFEPELAAPLVKNCHLFLLFSDLEAGHAHGTERPLVERINTIRRMFEGAMVAGRVTIGAGAVTDPGADVLIPELARYISWEDLRKEPFLRSILTEVGHRLGALAS